MTRTVAAIFLLLCQSAAAATVVQLPHENVLRFIITGDAGATHSELREGIVAVSARTHIDAIMLVGDNFYPCGIDGLADPQWTKITQHFGPSHLPIYAILGNHDYGDQQEHAGAAYSTCGHPDPGAEVQATGKIPQWHLPARNYVLESSLADFVMLDTQPIALGFQTSIAGSATAHQEVAWLTSTLSGLHSHWRIVVGHHTIYSSGMHGRKNDATQQRMRALLPLLRSDHVDLYVCGHDHDMEVLGDLRHGTDPVFLVSGAGSGLDEMRPRKPVNEPATIYPAFPSTPYIGFAVLEVSQERLKITLYDRAGSPTGGPFLVTKHG